MSFDTRSCDSAKEAFLIYSFAPRDKGVNELYAHLPFLECSHLARERKYLAKILNCVEIHGAENKKCIDKVDRFRMKFCVKQLDRNSV